MRLKKSEEKNNFLESRRRQPRSRTTSDDAAPAVARSASVLVLKGAQSTRVYTYVRAYAGVNKQTYIYLYISLIIYVRVNKQITKRNHKKVKFLKAENLCEFGKLV